MNPAHFGAIVLTLGVAALSTDAFAQGATATTTTESVTTTRGAFTEFVPASRTIVIKTETAPAPVRYGVTERTVIVDEAGTPLTVETIPAGAALSVQYVPAGERLVASRIVVRKAAPVSVAPAVIERRTTTVAPAPAPAPVVVEKRRTTTTTTTTAPLTEDEKEALEEAREERKERLEEQIEKRQERLEDLKDRLED